jgi:hypothetical protein
MKTFKPYNPDQLYLVASIVTSWSSLVKVLSPLQLDLEVGILAAE